MNTEKALKQEIVKSAKVVKQKVKAMRNLQNETENVFETVFKPITDPLNHMVNQNELTVKSLKEEIDSECQSTPKRIKLDSSNIKHTPSFDKTINELNYDETDNADNDDKSLNHDDDESLSFDENDTPTSDKCDTENEERNSDTSDHPTFDSLSSLDQNFLSPLSYSPKAFENIPFGVRMDRGKLMMGDRRVFVAEKTISVGGITYKKTPGLVQLLLKKKPQLELVTPDDKQNYKLILYQTNAHRRDFDPLKPIKSNRGYKYLNIVKPLLKPTKKCDSTDSVSVGNGLPLLKKLKPNIDYVYWDDPNELVERLKLLVASREAGNTGLDNEIISIIEEMRENGVIN